MDNTYNKLLDYEKKISTKLLVQNKENIINSIINNDKLASIPKIKDKLIQKITTNEESINFIKNKIKEEINIITENELKFKINNLNILLVGRNGDGKTTLINYILGCNYYNHHINNNDDFVLYSSQEINYLKIIEVKGIGYDAESTPENIGRKINNFINKNKKDNDENYNNIIHCIWFCITGSRIEDGEKILFSKLQKVYKDNTMPIIFVYTTIESSSIIKKMENDLKKNDINKELVSVLAKEAPLVDGDKIEPFGKEKLLKITLKKCAEALNSDMINIMIKQISNDIEDKLIKKNEEIKKKIIHETENNFIQNFKNVLNDGDFILYITNLFFDNLIEFYDNKEKIKNKNKNLFLKSDFISSLNNIYESYKKNIKDIIRPIVQEKSKDYINVQSNFEKGYGNMSIINKRNLDEFENTIEIFLKKNYYFIAQNYIINFLIRAQNNSPFNKFLSLISEELNSLIKSLTSLKNKDKETTEIINQLEYCFKEKSRLFSQINDIEIKIDKANNIPELSNSNKSISIDESLENPFENSNSFIFYNNQEANYNLIKEIIIDPRWINLKDNNWKFLKPGLKEKIIQFFEEFHYQISSINFTKDDNIFNFIQNEIKKDLINFLILI